MSDALPQADYRKEYGVLPIHLAQAHAAFIAGWKAHSNGGAA